MKYIVVMYGTTGEYRTEYNSEAKAENAADNIRGLGYEAEVIKEAGNGSILKEVVTMKTYELTPTDSHKSFYGKAFVEVAADGSETLYSYNTPIIKRTAAGELVKLWDGWSATTGRHIAAFCGLNKAAYMNL